MYKLSRFIACWLLFPPLSFGGSFAIAPQPSKHSKLELSKIKGVLLSSDNNISALSSISEQDEEEGKLLEFYMFNPGWTWAKELISTFSNKMLKSI